MNVFDDAMAKGRIRDARDLKVLFWTLAKKLHPDIAASPAGEQAFIKLKRDFDETILTLSKGPEDRREPPFGTPDFRKCTDLFSQLVAGNFPMARKEGNKKYVERIQALNRELGLFGFGDLFLDCERELLGIRGDCVVMNHPFNVVRLYFYNLSDFFSTGNYFSKVYVTNNRESVITCLEKLGAGATIRLIDWLLSELAS